MLAHLKNWLEAYGTGCAGDDAVLRVANGSKWAGPVIKVFFHTSLPLQEWVKEI